MGKCGRWGKEGPGKEKRGSCRSPRSGCFWDRGCGRTHRALPAPAPGLSRRDVRGSRAAPASPLGPPPVPPSAPAPPCPRAGGAGWGPGGGSLRRGRCASGRRRSASLAQPRPRLLPQDSGPHIGGARLRRIYFRSALFFLSIFF